MIQLGNEAMPDIVLLTKIKLFVDGHERQQATVGLSASGAGGSINHIRMERGCVAEMMNC